MSHPCSEFCIDPAHDEEYRDEDLADMTSGEPSRHHYEFDCGNCGERITALIPCTALAEPSTEEWSAHGLAAMDELRRLYFEGSDGHPGHITVIDWQVCEDAIRTALLGSRNHD
jgi:hypothetical protein